MSQDDENKGTAIPKGMLVHFSVYTASNGYDWTNIPDGTDRDGLDFYYQKASELKPDFMEPGDVVKGVFAQGGYVAAFRIQIVRHWDDFGRNAEYCAFAFMDYQDARQVDFAALLEMPEFTQPSHQPPMNVCYHGVGSAGIDDPSTIEDVNRLYHGESLSDFDFSKIGSLISRHGRKCDSWFICRVETSFEHACSVTTGKWREDPFPPPPPPPPSPKPVVEARFTSGVPVRGTASDLKPKSKSQFGSRQEIKYRPPGEHGKDNIRDLTAEERASFSDPLDNSDPLDKGLKVGIYIGVVCIVVLLTLLCWQFLRTNDQHQGAVSKEADGEAVVNQELQETQK